MAAISPALRRAFVLCLLALTLLALGGGLAPPVAAQTDDGADADRRTVEVLPLRGGFIDPPVTAQILEVIEVAEDAGSELVVLQYSSAGGVSADLDTLLERIRSSPVPVAVFVGPVGNGAEAAGAAGLLWLGADIRAVAPDATVGPLAPADLAADVTDTAARARELVSETGADAVVADQLRSGALDADALHGAGAATIVSQSLQPLLLDLDGTTVDTGDGARQLTIRPDEVEVRFHSLGLLRRLLHAATTAPFIYLLLVVGVGMLLFELFQPGFGVAGLAGLVTTAIGAFGLTVLPVAWWAVALLLLGLVLFAVDTAIAGFGPVTAAATAAVLVGSRWLYTAEPLVLSWWLIAATTATVLVFFVFVMTSLLRAQAGPEGVSTEQLIGSLGTVRSVCNPEGHVYIDGALWRARWTGDSRRAKVGTPVRVHAVDGPVVLVERFEPRTAAVTGADDRVDG